MPQGKRADLSRPARRDGWELFSCIHFGMDDWGNWRLNLFQNETVTGIASFVFKLFKRFVMIGPLRDFLLNIVG